MNRKVIFLNLLLIVAIGSLGWALRLRWLAEKAHEQDVLRRSVQARRVFDPPALIPPKPVMAVEYLQVAQQTLFSKDRNPTVVVPVEAPPPPKPEPVMPALPNFHGTIMFGDPVVILSDAKGNQKGYHKGDSIGPFKVIEFDRDNITFEWNGKKVERKLQDLVAKESTPSQAAAPAAATPAPAGAAVTSLAVAPSPPTSKDSPVGTDMGAGYRGCTTGDTRPAGTVVDGYKKVVAQGLMGMSCHWELVK